MAVASPAGPWRDLRLRLASAALLGPVVLACIWLGSAWFSALIVLTMLGLGWEWVRMAGGASLSRQGVAVPGSVVAGSLLAALGLPLAGMAVLLAGAGAAHALAGRLPARFLAAGVLYVGLAGVALIALRGDAAAGRGNVLFLFAVVWASDIGAYLAGRALGGPKLAPAISPNKTWSGALGGLLSAVTAGLIAAYVMDAAGIGARAALVAALLGLLTQAGDLFESWIKRRFHVKDTSSLIPGHGGLLDRLDGVLAAAPAAALIGTLLGPGAPLWR